MAVKVVTTRFGEFDLTEDQVFHLTQAVPGFPNTKSFFFIKKDKIAPFQWLQSVEEADLTFVVVEPQNFFHDYAPPIGAFEIKEIGLDRREDASIYVIVVLPEDMSKMTANLRGPLIINQKERKMKQTFIDTDKWSVRESIIEGIKKKEQALLEKQKQQQA